MPSRFIPRCRRKNTLHTNPRRSLQQMPQLGRGVRTPSEDSRQTDGLAFLTLLFWDSEHVQCISRHSELIVENSCCFNPYTPWKWPQCTVNLRKSHSLVLGVWWPNNPVLPRGWNFHFRLVSPECGQQRTKEVAYQPPLTGVVYIPSNVHSISFFGDNHDSGITE